MRKGVKKVEQKIWLHSSTFIKSRAKDLAPPFLKVDSKGGKGGKGGKCGIKRIEN